MTNMHQRWVTVLTNSEADKKAGRDMVGWVGVSTATLSDFARRVVHGRRVDVDQHCTPNCPGKHR